MVHGGDESALDPLCSLATDSGTSRLTRIMAIGALGAIGGARAA